MNKNNVKACFNQMKFLLLSMVVAVLAFGVVACGGSGDSGDKKSKDTNNKTKSVEVTIESDFSKSIVLQSCTLYGQKIDLPSAGLPNHENVTVILPSSLDNVTLTDDGKLVCKDASDNQYHGIHDVVNGKHVYTFNDISANWGTTAAGLPQFNILKAGVDFSKVSCNVRFLVTNNYYELRGMSHGGAGSGVYEFDPAHLPTSADTVIGNKVNLVCNGPGLATTGHVFPFDYDVMSPYLNIDFN